MVNVTQLLSLNIGQFEAAADQWYGVASKLYQSRDGFAQAVVDPLKGHKWQGETGDAASKVCENIRLDMEAVAVEAQGVQKFLDKMASGSGDGSGNLRKHQQDLQQLQQEVLNKNMRLEDDGTVHVGPSIRAPGPLSPEEQQQQNQKMQEAAGFEKRAKAILKAATEVDDNLARGLKVIFGDKTTFRTEHRWRHTKDSGDADTERELELRGVQGYLKVRGWNDAANLFDHYLDGSGKPVNIDANRLLNDSPTFQQDVNSSLGDVRKMPDGTFQTPWKGSSSPANQNLNWYYALNNFQYRLVGEKHGGQIQYHVEVQKRYDWGVPTEHRRDLPKNVGPVSLGHFEQSQLARLNQIGAAKDFDVHGTTETKTTH
jgi:hypothetical protein